MVKGQSMTRPTKASLQARVDALEIENRTLFQEIIRLRQENKRLRREKLHVVGGMLRVV